MKADCIKEIIGKLNELPYQCILFDGKWGIGKTYAIDETLKDCENVCRISMFGLEGGRQIYHEAFFQLALKNSMAGKVSETAAGILESISAISDKVGFAKDIVSSVAKERELFLLLSKKFHSWHFIVIDDLERISNKVDLENVLGIVEELKQCHYIKIIIAANLRELTDFNRTIFEKYNEKVIDRIYHITERPDKVEWSKLGIHAGFIEDFLSVHQVKNLRTLQKAQNFYDDVILHFETIKNQHFLEEVRLICFAIVVESIDRLYYKEVDKKEDKSAYDEIRNNLEYRVSNYLAFIKSSKSLLTMLLKYYNNETALSKDEIETEYQLFLEAGKKPNFYKTDEEIRLLLPEIYQKALRADSVYWLLKHADEYAFWSDIIKQENRQELEELRKKLHDMLWSKVMAGEDNYINYYDIWHLSSDQIKRIYKEERGIVGTAMIKAFIKGLAKKVTGKEAYEYSYKLRQYFNNTTYRKIIAENIAVLYNSSSFPIGDILSEDYYTYYNMIYVLYYNDRERFDYCIEEIKKSCDHMSAYRIDNLLKEIRGEVQL